MVWLLLMLVVICLVNGDVWCGLGWLICGVGVVSLIVCIVVFLVKFKYVFFFVLMWVWEFGVGMFVVLCFGLVKLLSWFVFKVIGLLVLVVLVVMVFGFNGNLCFLGYWVVILVVVVVGLLLVVECGWDLGVGWVL